MFVVSYFGTFVHLWEIPVEECPGGKRDYSYMPDRDTDMVGRHWSADHINMI